MGSDAATVEQDQRCRATLTTQVGRGKAIGAALRASGHVGVRGQVIGTGTARRQEHVELFGAGDPGALNIGVGDDLQRQCALGRVLLDARAGDNDCTALTRSFLRVAIGNVRRFLSKGRNGQRAKRDSARQNETGELTCNHINPLIHRPPGGNPATLAQEFGLERGCIAKAREVRAMLPQGNMNRRSILRRDCQQSAIHCRQGARPVRHVIRDDREGQFAPAGSNHPA